MKNRKNTLTVGLLILSILLINSINTVQANFSVYATINDAWYADLDADSLEDDIGANITLTVSNYYILTDVDLYLNLVLPSGTEFWFLSLLTVEKYTYTASFILIYHMFNTALEEGWYTLNSVGFAEGEQFSMMDSYVFDPPGISKGDPQSAILYDAYAI